MTHGQQNIKYCT